MTKATTARGLKAVLEEGAREHPVLARLVWKRDTDDRTGLEAGGRVVVCGLLAAGAARQDHRHRDDESRPDDEFLH